MVVEWANRHRRNPTLSMEGRQINQQTRTQDDEEWKQKKVKNKC